MIRNRLFRILLIFDLKLKMVKEMARCFLKTLLEYYMLTLYFLGYLILCKLQI